MVRRAVAHPNAPIVFGLALGVATTAAYLIGSGRSLGYDAAATFANFIATPSLLDAFAVHPVVSTIILKSIASNDHVFFSLVSHVIYSLTGSRSEVVYRLIPALAAGGTVGVSAVVLSRRFGLLAGLCAGLFIATNPLFVDNSRDLRGYSLAALLALLATLLVLDRTATWSRRRLVAYSVLLGLAIATHVFAIVVLAAHVVWIALRRSRADIKSLIPAWVGAFAIGAAANANIEIMVFLQHGFPPSVFDPTFPRDLVLFL
ncbi:MAG TPA: glycosyltransferase family 39 protein, partial [Candidatus Dormibacteraeota bacterium]